MSLHDMKLLAYSESGTTIIQLSCTANLKLYNSLTQDPFSLPISASSAPFSSLLHECGSGNPFSTNNFRAVLLSTYPPPAGRE